MNIPKKQMETQPKSDGILILDIPVPHKGYIDLLKKHTDGSVKTLFLVGNDLRDSLELPKEIRANDPEITRKMLMGLGLSFDIEIINLDGIGRLPVTGIYTAHDRVSRKLREKFFPNAEVTEETPFLRWDESNVTSTRPALIDEETDDPFHVAMMKRARELAEDSSDWWRRVGVVIVRNKRIMLEAYNQSFPTDHKPYIDGNPRDHLKAGTLAFLVSTVHGEQAVIAKAANRGIILEGTDLYLNSFPCPPCATSMGLAGIKRCFSGGGNAYLDAAEVLKAVGIKSIFVKEG